MSKKCSFTGHRQIKSEHLPKMADLLTRAINFAYSEGCREFLSGGAVGFDAIAAREVVRFRMTHPDVRLVMLLPCVDQDRGWSEAQRQRYAYILSSADEVIYVSDEYTADCMRERNARLAQECDILIAYLYKSASGAGQTARMAARLGKKVYNLYQTLDKN